MSSLGGRLRILTLGVTVILTAAALLAVSRLRALESSVTGVLSRNYRSIEAAQGMAAVVAGLRLAVHEDRCASGCPPLEAEFERRLAVVHANYTEPGEPELAQAIDRKARALFAAARARALPERIDADAETLAKDLRALVALNESGMFAADRHTRALANRLMLGTLAALALLAVVVGAVGWRLAGTLARSVDAVLDEKTKTDAVIESIEDGLVVLDPAGVVVHANEVACAILGLERTQLLGRPFTDLGASHPHYLRIREALRDFRMHPDEAEARVEVTLFLRGRDHHYVLRPSPFRTREGTSSGTIVVLQDVTYLRDQEARREHLVGTLSHELGSPLTSLRLAVELLQRDEGRLPPEHRPLLGAAREDVERLQDLAQRLLDLARMRATAIAVERRNVDLGEVVPRVLRMFTPQARDKGVALESTMPSAGLTIAGDPTKLAWALSNLCANALRYTPAGGRVQVEVTPEEEAVLVAVSDDGPGIPPEARERIFERFTQSADGGDAGAAGLGLAIVRDIVQAHGGRIRLESALGRGSRFTLELPRG